MFCCSVFSRYSRIVTALNGNCHMLLAKAFRKCKSANLNATKKKSAMFQRGTLVAPPQKNEALPLTQYCKRILPIFKSCRAEEAVGWRTRVQYYSRRSRVMSHPILFFQTESNFQGRSHAYEREAADITFLSELKIPKRKKGAT